MYVKGRHPFILELIPLGWCLTLGSLNANTAAPSRSNQDCCGNEAPVKPAWLSKHGSNVFPAEFKEDEILRRTTLLFLLRSKSPLRPSGVNKGRCSKWYANWKKEREKNKKKLHKSTRRSRISDTSHLKKKISVFRVKFKVRSSSACVLVPVLRRHKECTCTSPRHRRPAFGGICFWI